MTTIISKKIVLATTWDVHNFIQTLPFSYTHVLEDGSLYDILLHTSPNYIATSEGIKVNFDFWMPKVRNINNEEILNDRYLKTALIDKSGQAKLLAKFNDFHAFSDHGQQKIKYPYTVCSSDEAALISSISARMITLAVNRLTQKNIDKVILKRDNGARGHDQVLVPTKDLLNFSKLMHGMSQNDLQHRFPSVKFSEPLNDEYVRNGDHRKKTDEIERIKKEQGFMSRHNDNYHIQQYIENITHELRLLKIGNFYYLINRVIDRDKDIPQPNVTTCDIKEHTGVCYQRLPQGAHILSFLNDDLNTTKKYSIKSILEFAESLNAPLLSIDLYITSDSDQVGILEFSTEFGMTRGFSPKILLEMQNDFYDYIVERYKKLNNLL